jgi:hypothetical protein
VLNAALARRLGRDASSRLNATAVVAANDAAALADRIARQRSIGERGAFETFTLNFVDETGAPMGVRCWMDVQPRYALLVGEHAACAAREVAR